MSERISHDEATEILRRFENSHFNKPGEKARASIPADLDRDDDLRMQRYIDEQRALTDSLRAAGLLTEEGEVRKVLGTLPVTGDDHIAGFPPGYGSLFGRGRHIPIDRFDPVCMWYDNKSRCIMVRTNGVHSGIDFDGVPIGTLYSTREAALAAQARKDGGQ